MRVLVIGAGAIGGVAGGYLTRAGEDVLLVDRAEDHVRAMQRRGLFIDGVQGEQLIPVRAAMPEELAGRFDVVLVAVKSQHTPQALELVPEHLAPDGVAVSLQNGINNKALMAEKVGAERTIGAMVRLGGASRGPGHVTHLTGGLFAVGELDGRMTPRLEMVRQLLDKVAPTTATDNLFGWLWAKETYGCLLKVTALVDATIGEVLALPGAEKLVTRAMRECAAVARAEGVRLETFDFLDPNALLGDTPDDVARTRRNLATISSRFGHTKSGIWRDIVVRRIPTEVRFLTGEIVRHGDRVGVPTPLLSRVAEMIAEIERGERRMSPDNLAELATAGA